MKKGLKTRVRVELEDTLLLFDSTDADTYNQLGVDLNSEFKHYSVAVGTILNFREIGGYFTGKHEVVSIQTITYPSTQHEGTEHSFDLMIVYYVKRLFP